MNIMMKIETYTIMAFLIAISAIFLVSYVAAHVAALEDEDKDWEKLEAEDEREHEEWASENADSDILSSYKFVHCPGDDNTYPEGTKCDDDEDEEEEGE